MDEHSDSTSSHASAAIATTWPPLAVEPTNGAPCAQSSAIPARPALLGLGVLSGSVTALLELYGWRHRWRRLVPLRLLPGWGSSRSA